VLEASNNYVSLVIQKTNARKMLFIISFNHILYKVVFGTITIVERFELSKYISSGLANEYLQNGEIHFKTNESYFNKLIIIRMEYNSKLINL